MPTYKRISQADEVIELDDLEEYLKLDSEASTIETQLVLDAAVTRVENYCRRTVLSTQWQCTQDDFESGINLKYGPVHTDSVVIKTIASDGTETVMLDTEYYVIRPALEACVVLNEGVQWPTDFRSIEGIVVEYTAGWKSDLLPNDLKLAIMQLCAYLFENREVNEQMPVFITQVLDSYKVRSL